MFLITTADERSWKIDEKILFLGEWCKLYSRKYIWKKLKYETVPYHWDDRNKYYEDYRYLSNLYEKYLTAISKALNEINGHNYSKRYWRIVIGPWLRFFMDSIYDRYSSIQSAIKFKQVTSTLIMDTDITKWIPKDYKQFYTDYTTDQWNHLIYGEIIKGIGSIPYDIIKENNHPIYQKNNKSVINRLKINLNNFYTSCIPDRFNKFVFISSYFVDYKDLIKLQLSLGQLPYLHGPIVEASDLEENMDLRVQLKTNLNGNQFESILDDLIAIQMPKTYLEGFNNLKILASKHYPKKVEGIYTANSFLHNDVFKVWAAGIVEKGKKLFIGQHGGNLGTALWSQREDHQIAVSNKYFSWGWYHESYNHIKPMPAAKLLNLKNKIVPKSSGHVLSVLASLPRYFYCSYSVPTAGQFLNYINFQVQLTKLLEPSLLNLFRMRLDSADFGWNMLERFAENGLSNNIETNEKKLFNRLKECRLCIVPHNATVFLETFTSNFPTILFWNPKYYEIRETAREYFDELKRVGILHYSPESASVLLNKIYHNPNEWWMQEEIQVAKDRFCENYAYINDNWINKWKDELLNSSMKQHGDD